MSPASLAAPPRPDPRQSRGGPVRSPQPPLRHRVVSACQVCAHRPLDPVLFLGYQVPVNLMPPAAEPMREQPAFPAQLLICPRCRLAQLGFIADPRVLFPPDYPYTTGTTRLLRDNFAQLAAEAREVVGPAAGDLVIDIGANDGTLLGNFQRAGWRVLGIEPTLKAAVANERGIPSLMRFFTPDLAAEVRREHGPARLVTATNVFAHIPNVDEVLEGITTLLAPDGVFISESHYFGDLVSTLQYDTIYHEHLRYYAVRSLTFLLERHGYRIFRVRRIPTHGGSIRVYAARDGARAPDGSVEAMAAEEEGLRAGSPLLREFRQRVVMSKLALHALLHDLKRAGAGIVGIGAPSRASTLITYIGLDDGILECVYEVKGSSKIGRCMPGTAIPVLEESGLYAEQPEYALLLSWHLAEELAPKLKAQGYRGDFIVPLPAPRILRHAEVA